MGNYIRSLERAVPKCHLLKLFTFYLQLDKIKRGEGLLKDHDETQLANTFDPDDIKSKKSNKRREQEQLNGVKGEFRSFFVKC